MANNVENLEFKELSEIPVTENKDGLLVISIDSNGNDKVYPLDNFKTSDEVDKLLKEKAADKDLQDAKTDINILKKIKADKTDVNTIKSEITDLQNNKLDKSELENLQIAIKQYEDPVTEVEDLPLEGNTEGDGRTVRNDKNDSGQAYIWVWNGTKWSRTPFTEFPSNIATKEELYLKADLKKPTGERVVYSDELEQIKVFRFDAIGNNLSALKSAVIDAYIDGAKVTENINIRSVENNATLLRIYFNRGSENIQNIYSEQTEPRTGISEISGKLPNGMFIRLLINWDVMPTFTYHGDGYLFADEVFKAIEERNRSSFYSEHINSISEKLEEINMLGKSYAHTDGILVENSFASATRTLKAITSQNNYIGNVSTDRMGIYPHSSLIYTKVASPDVRLQVLDFYQIPVEIPSNPNTPINILIATSDADYGFSLPKITTIGFWVDKATLVGALYFTFTDGITGEIFSNINPSDLVLGFSAENSKGKIAVKDQIGNLVFVHFAAATTVSQLYVILKNTGGGTGVANVMIGGVSYAMSDVFLNPRVKYMTRGERNYPNLQGKKVCFVGDSNTAGLANIRAFQYLTGVNDVICAAISGASIGNPVQASGEHVGNWIKNFKEYIVANNPDVVILNVSSNDTAWFVGDLSEVNNPDVTISYYKHYSEFINWLLTNNQGYKMQIIDEALQSYQAVADATGTANLVGTDKCILMMGYLTNIGDSNTNAIYENRFVTTETESKVIPDFNSLPKMQRPDVAMLMKKAAKDIADRYCVPYLDVQNMTGARPQNNVDGDGIHTSVTVHSRTAYLQAKMLNDYYIANK